MKKIGLSVAAQVGVLCTLTMFFVTSGRGQNDNKKAQSAGRHTEVQVSDETHTTDSLEMKLTPGQKKAISDSRSLQPGSAAVFKSDGALFKKGLAKEVDKIKRECKDIRPISDKCWLCKDDGNIFCSAASKSGSKSNPSSPHLEPNF